MKIKTKLLSVLGATAIATSGLGLIASCSYSSKHVEKYDAPGVRHSGETTYTTNPGVTECEVSTFITTRELHVSEKLVFTAIEVEGGAIKSITTLYNSASELSLKVNLDIPDSEIMIAKSIKFRLSCVASYHGQSKDISLDNQFIINYQPLTSTKIVTVDQSFPGFDFSLGGSARGNDTLVYQADVTPFALSAPLEDGEEIAVESEDWNIKASIQQPHVSETKIPLIIKVVDYKDDTKLDKPISLTFKIYKNGALTWASSLGEFRVYYLPAYKENRITFAGSSGHFTTERGTPDKPTQNTIRIEGANSFYLSRELSEGNIEKVTDIQAIDQSGSPITSIISIDPQSIEIVDKYFINFDLAFTPADYNEPESVEFQLKFTIREEALSTPHTQIVNTKGSYPVGTTDWHPFTFDWPGQWVANYATWEGDPSQKALIADGVPSFYVDGTAGVIRLHRNLLVENNEQVKVKLVDNDGEEISKLQCTYDVVDINSYQIITLNISLNDTSITSPIPFNIELEFYENDKLVWTQDPTQDPSQESSLAGFTFKYVPPTVPVSLAMQNAVTKPGELHVDVKGVLSESLKSGETLTVDNSKTVQPKDGSTVKVINEATKISGNIVTFKVFITLPADKTIFDGDRALDDIKFYVTPSIQTEKADFTLPFNITFKAGEEWNKKQSFEGYMQDRSFSLATTYNKATSPSFATGWVLSDATPTNHTDYSFWIATTFEYYLNYMDSKSETGFKFYVSDGNLAQLGNNINRSEWNTSDNEFIEIPSSSVLWQTDRTKFRLYRKTIAYTANGMPNMYVAKVDFSKAFVDDTIQTALLKEKLNKLNTERPTDTAKVNSWLKNSVADSTNFSNFYSGGYVEGKQSTSYYTQWKTWNNNFTNFQYSDGYDSYWELQNDGMHFVFDADNSDGEWRHYAGSYNNLVNDDNPLSNWDDSSLSPGSMMVARNKSNQIYVLGMYVEWHYYSGWGDTDYYPWFDSYYDTDTKIDVFTPYYESAL